MTRKEKILRHIDKKKPGLEIGPSHSPIAPKREGFNVHVIDLLDKDGLLEKYTGHDVNTERIEDVDFVWHGETYQELTGKSKYYDWIIASHVIEHTPDLIDFLNNCDAVLKDDGVISLAVPDKRYCFDHFRPLTGLADIVDSHIRKDKTHTRGRVMEYYMNIVYQGESIAWNSSTTGKYKFIFPPDKAHEKIDSIINDKTYSDVHAWCFVPHSFRLLINDLYELKFISFKELDFYPSAGSEFHITLSRKGKGIEKSRLEMLTAIEAEIKEKNESLAQDENHAKNRLYNKAKSTYKIFGEPFKPSLKKLKNKLL